MERNKEILNFDDVITIQPKWNYMGCPTFKAAELVQKLANHVTRSVDDQQEWFFDGVECEVLSPKQDWRKGKIKITIEFIPEESNQPDPDLNGLRQLIVE